MLCNILSFTFDDCSSVYCIGKTKAGQMTGSEINHAFVFRYLEYLQLTDITGLNLIVRNNFLSLLILNIDKILF